MSRLELVSDKEQVLCKLSYVWMFIAGLLAGLLLALSFRVDQSLPQKPSIPGSVNSTYTISAFPQSSDWSEPVRLLKVVHRKPVPFLLHPDREDAANYLGVYCVETLECGHKVTTFPQTDSLIAIRRDCKDCGSNLIEISFPAHRKKAA